MRENLGEFSVHMVMIIIWGGCQAEVVWIYMIGEESEEIQITNHEWIEKEEEDVEKNERYKRV